MEGSAPVSIALKAAMNATPSAVLPRNTWEEMRIGWPTLLGATLGAGLGVSSLPFYTAGTFVPELEQQFGWSREQLSLGSLLAMLAMALGSPFAGSLIDRYGVLRPVAISIVALGISFAALAIQPGNYLLYLAIVVLQSALASAASPIAYTRAVNARFVYARGLALGITLGGVGLTAAAAPLIVVWIMQVAGWRGAYAAMAGIVLLSLPLVLLLLRTNSAGVEPRITQTGTDAPVTISWRDGPFFRLVAVFLVLALGLSGLVFHLIPMLRDTGLSAAEAAGVQGVMGTCILIGRLVIGWSLDRFFAPYVAVMVMTITAAGLLALAWGGVALAVPAAAAAGFAMGAEVDLIGYLAARYYGLRAYGRIYGLLFATFLIGTGASPVLISTVQAYLGGYPVALTACSLLVFIAAVLFLVLPRFPQISSKAA